MIYRRILLPTLCLLSVATLPLQVAAQTLPSEPTAPAMDAPMRVATPQTAEKLYSFKFEGADLDTVMETYCEWTG